MAIKAHYHGKDGEFYEGIPARHLSEEEYAALDVEQKRLVRYGGLYKMADDKPAEHAKSAEQMAPTEAGAQSPPDAGEKGGG